MEGLLRQVPGYSLKFGLPPGAPKAQHTVTVRSVFERFKIILSEFLANFFAVYRGWNPSQVVRRLAAKIREWTFCQKFEAILQLSRFILSPCCSTLVGIQKEAKIFWPPKPGEFWFLGSPSLDNLYQPTQVNQLTTLKLCVCTDARTCNNKDNYL